MFLHAERPIVKETRAIVECSSSVALKSLIF